MIRTYEELGYVVGADGHPSAYHPTRSGAKQDVNPAGLKALADRAKDETIPARERIRCLQDYREASPEVPREMIDSMAKLLRESSELANQLRVCRSLSGLISEELKASVMTVVASSPVTVLRKEALMLLTPVKSDLAVQSYLQLLANTDRTEDIRQAAGSLLSTR